MKQLLRLAFLTVMTFVAMSAYFLIPAQQNCWEKVSEEHLVAKGEEPVVSIFFGNSRNVEQVKKRLEDAKETKKVTPEVFSGELPWKMWKPRKGKPEPEVEKKRTGKQPSVSKEREKEEKGKKAPEEDGPQEKAPKRRKSPESRYYVVKKNDTLISISREALGSGKYVRALRKCNKGIKARKLAIGQRLRLPDISGETSEAGGSSSSARSTKLVPLKKGETLYKLAEIYCGSKEKWRTIVALNRKRISGRDLHKLPVGFKVRVPAGTAGR